jgi:hypothetical protein
MRRPGEDLSKVYSERERWRCLSHSFFFLLASTGNLTHSKAEPLESYLRAVP